MAIVDPADLTDASEEGFAQGTAEKVYRLIGLLREIQGVQSAKGRFTLKGGTALNVFHSAAIPRLSVDIDLMATGYEGAVSGSAEHARVVGLVASIASKLGYHVSKTESPAACTVTCGYRNLLGGQDQVKIDLDILNRQTILPAEHRRGPGLFHAEDLTFPVVSEAELIGQKLVAVAYRAHPRDLYDMRVMLRAGWHRHARSRQMYLAYSFLQDHEWHRLDYPVRLEIPYPARVLEDVLRGGEPAPSLAEIREIARNSLGESDPPYTSATADEEALRAELLSGDRSAFAAIAGETSAARTRKLATHPGLEWRLRQAARTATPS